MAITRGFTLPSGRYSSNAVRPIFEQTVRSLFSLFTIHGSHFGGLSPASLFQFGFCRSLQLPPGGSIANRAAAKVTPRQRRGRTRPENPKVDTRGHRLESL